MKITDLLNHVNYLVPDAPTPVIEVALRRSISRFMMSTRLFLEETTFKMEPGVADYIIPKEDCKTIIQIEEVRKTKKKCQNLISCAWEEIPPAMNCEGFGYYVDSLGAENTNVTITPTPNHVGVIGVKYSWSIGTGDCEIPDQLGTLYLETIIQGTLYYLYSMVGTEWYNKGVADEQHIMYDHNLRLAKTRRLTNGARAPIKINPPRLLGGRR